MAELSLRSVKGRVTASYLSQVRAYAGSADTITSWHTRIDDVHEVLKGDFVTITAGEETDIDKPLVQNTAEKRVRDVARLVAETRPIPRGYPKNDEKDEQDKARLRASIAETYWDVNEGDTFTPEWAMDLQVAGAAFAVAYMPSGNDIYGDRYPRFERVDPRMCFPIKTAVGLYDLLVIKKMHVDVAEAQFPGKGIAEAYKASKSNGWQPEVEIWEYYCEKETVKAVAFFKGSKPAPGGVTILERSDDSLGCPLAIMVTLPSWNDEFVGQLDGIKGSLYAKNKAVKLIMDHTEEAVEASLEAKGIINADELPGRHRIYQHDPMVPDSKIGRVAPASFNPMLLQVLGLLDREQHSELSYPAARQGVVSQSIASAAFTESVQGDLSSVVRELHRLLGRMRRELTAVLAKLDCKYGDEQKPLLRPIQKKNTYKPSRDWDGRFRIEFVYGPSSGIGVINGDQRLVQFNGIGAMSFDTLRSHAPDLFPDPEAEGDKIERETNAKAIQQRFLTDPTVTLDTITDVLLLQEQRGLSLVEATMIARREALEKQQAAAAQTPEQAAGELPQPAGPQPGPVDAEAEALALEKGKVPDEGGPEQLDVEQAIPPRTLPQLFINAGGRP